MFIQALDTTADFTVALLIHYSFDLGGYTAGELIDYWLKDYPANWIRLAVIEALYQGRYKAISVEQILAVWNRRGQALHHFNHEFERLICGNLPQTLTGQPDTRANASPAVVYGVGFSNGHDDSAVVTANESVEANEDAGGDAYATTNQIGEEPANEKSHQTSYNDQKLRSRKLSSALSPKLSFAPSPRSGNPAAIEQFTSVDEGSYFYTKLKAIAKASVNAPDEDTRR